MAENYNGKTSVVKIHPTLCNVNEIIDDPDAKFPCFGRPQHKKQKEFRLFDQHNNLIPDSTIIADGGVASYT